MENEEVRRIYLGCVETALRGENPDLPGLRISAQSHYGPKVELAFIQIFGADDNRERRRMLRRHATEFLARLGIEVRLDTGRDVYDVTPSRRGSAHECLQMMCQLRHALETSRREEGP